MSAALCPLPHRDGRELRVGRGLVVCGGHLRGLQNDVASIPGLYRTLERHLVSSGSGESGGRRGDEIGANLNPEVMDARHELRNLLVTWVRVTVDEGPWQHYPADSLDEMMRWLVTRSHWIGARAWAPEMVTDVRWHVGRGRHLVQPNTTYRVEIGPCPEVVLSLEGDAVLATKCEGTVIAVMHRAASREMLPGVIECTAHGEDEEAPHRWTPTEWHTLGRKMGRSDHGNAVDAFLRSLG